jgi:hypothetical protein
VLPYEFNRLFRGEKIARFGKRPEKTGITRRTRRNGEHGEDGSKEVRKELKKERRKTELKRSFRRRDESG